MKRFALPVLLVSFVLLLVSGCRKKEDPENENFKLTVSPTSLVFPAEGGSQTVTITTDAPSCTVTPSDSWITMSSADNVLTVKVEANPKTESRNGTIKVEAGKIKTEVSVMQSGKSNRPADDPYPQASYGLDDDAIFVKSDYTKAITASDPAANTFTVPSSSVGSQKPEVGQKLIMNTPTDLFPSGLLAKVVSVSESGGNYQVKYEPLKLEEAFSDLNIDEQAINLADYVKEIRDAQGNKVAFAKTKDASSKTFHLQLPEASWPLDYAGLEIKPILELDLTLYFQAIVADYKLYTFNFDTEVGMKVGATIACGFEGKAIDERVPIYEIICGAIPVGPILITPTIGIDALLEVSGKVSVEATAHYTASRRYGIHYDANGGWTPNDYGEANKNGSFTLENVSPKVEGTFAYGYSIGPAIAIYVEAVSAGIGYDSKTKHTLSGAYDLLNGNLDDYMNWNVVQHLQNAEYAITDVEALSFSVTVLTREVLEKSTPDITNREVKWKVLPKLGAFPEFERVEDGLNLTVWVKNRNLFDGQLTAYVAENEKDLVHRQKMVFPDGREKIQSLNSEEAPDSVALKGFVHLDEEDPDLNYAEFVYEVSGVGRFNLGSYMQEFNDEQSRAALMAILKDLYQSKGEGAWADCNWFEKDISVYALKHVRVSRRGDKFYFKINIPAGWKLGAAVQVGDHSKNCPKFGGWEIIFEDGCTEKMNKLAILDSHFQGYYISIPYNFITDLTINSPIWTRYSDLGSVAHRFDRLDLSYTPLEEFEFRSGGISVKNQLILKECKNLKTLRFESWPQQSFDVTGCTALEEVHFGVGILEDGYFSGKGSGTEGAKLFLENTTLGTLSVPNNYKEIWVTDGASFDKVEIVGNKAVDHIDLRGSKGNSLEVSNCANLSTLSCPNTGISSFKVENLPGIVHLNVEDNEKLLSLVPEVFDEIADRGGSVEYDIRYSYTDTGTGVIEYEDNGYGFWYEGEPQCGYHGKEPPEQPGYDTNPNDTKAQAGFRKILKDLYDCRKSDWEGCNWGDASVLIKDMANVRLSSSSSGGNPYEEMRVTIPAEWDLMPDLLVRRHFEVADVAYKTSGYSDYWFLRIEGERKFNSFQISESRLAQLFVRGEAKLFALHSPYFSWDMKNGVIGRDNVEIPAKIQTLDLTGCDVNRVFYETSAENLPKKVVLSQSYYGYYGSVDGWYSFICTDGTPCPAPVVDIKKGTGVASSWRYTVVFGNMVIPDGDMNFVKGIPLEDPLDCKLEIENCVANNLQVPDFPYVSVSGKIGTVRATAIPHLVQLWVDGTTDSSIDNVIVESCESARLISIRGYSYTTGASAYMGSSVTVRDCPALVELGGDKSGYKTLRLQRLPALKYLKWSGSSVSSISVEDIAATTDVTITDNKSLTGVMPDWLIAVKKKSYDIRYEYKYHSGGANTNARGEKFDYTDKGYGFYYSGEPQSGVHGQ